MRKYRPFIVGTALAALINLWEPYSYYIVHSSWMRFGYLSVATMLPFVLLAFPVNIFLRWLRPAWAFEPYELVVIFSMAMIAAIFPTLGIIGFLLSFTISPAYFASPENQWNELLVKHLPQWLCPSDQGNAVTWFYEGLPVDQTIPWGAWVRPLTWWALLIFAIFVTCFCTMVILRKQWAENERLSYPLVQIPLALIEGSASRGRILPPFARSGAFWFGAAVPFFMICWNMIHYFYPTVPQVPIGKWRWLRLWKGFPPILAKVNIFVMAFAFFTPLDVLLSIWFYQLLVTVEVGIFNRTGFSIGRPDNWCTFNAATGWQSFGGFLVIVLIGFWMTRSHFKNVLLHALGRQSEVDDSRELMSYRAALVGTVLGAFFIAAWMHKAGMSIRTLALFLPMVYITYVGVSKLVAQTGLVYLWGPITPQSATFHILGSASMPTGDIALMGLTYCPCCNVERLVPSTAAHVARLSDNFPKARRGFLLAMAIAAVVSMVTGVWYTLYLGYRDGAANFNSFEFWRGNHWIFGIVVNKIRNPMPTDWARIAFMGGGAAIMALLVAVQYRIPWWPVHPLGFAVAGTHPVRMATFSIFLTWVIKFCIVKLGGGHLYERSKPFFVGAMVGYILGVGLSFAVDCIWFMGEGHVIHLW
ncbi:MAG: hypothetical protein GXP25_06910 [Planctomycetes bacterium]|nr:hypothetical protein [Planctomycetota bacterium]